MFRERYLPTVRPFPRVRELVLRLRGDGRCLAVASALQRLRCAPAETVMIGDTPYDVEAAARAGVPAIGFRCGGWDDEALRGAAALYDSAADLLDHWDKSPLSGGAP